MVLVVDSASLYVRAYYSSLDEDPLRSSSGVLFNAVDYFLQFCKSFRNKRKEGDKILFCFESSNSWRKTVSETYKRNRAPMPEELLNQLKYIKIVPALFGFKSWEEDGYEADDLIARVSVVEKGQLYIISGDKDFAGLLRPGVIMRDPLNSREVRDSSWVKKTFGVTYDQFYFFQALTGDTADGVSGVPGIGPVQAVKIVNRYKTLDSLTTAWSQAAVSWPKLLGQEQVFSDSYDLVNLSFVKDFPVPDMSLGEVDNDALRAFIVKCRGV